MKAEDFLLEVIKEVEHLRDNATQDEKDRLNFDSFDFTNSNRCIYGLMTGHCSSERAKELYPKNIRGLNLHCDIENGTNFTCLERYLFIVATSDYRKSKMHENIIDYIKGESDMIFYENI